MLHVTGTLVRKAPECPVRHLPLSPTRRGAAVISKPSSDQTTNPKEQPTLVDFLSIHYLQPAMISTWGIAKTRFASWALAI